MLRDLFAYVWSMLCLFPLLWIAALDFAAPGPRRAQRAPSGNWNLATTTLVAVAVACAFAGTSLLARMLHDSGSTPGAGLRGFGVSLLFHLVVFTTFGVALRGIGRAARWTPWPHEANFAGTHVLAVLISAGVIRSIILPTLSFDGLQADLFSVVVSLALVAYVAGTASLVRGTRAENTRQVKPRRGAAWWLIAGFLGLLGASYAIPAAFQTRDWDFALQRTAVVVVWSAALAFLRWTGVSLAGRTAKAASLLGLAMAVTGYGAYKAEVSYYPGAEDDWGGILDSYAGSDISFKTAYDVLSRSVNNEAHADFYQFLKRNTNLSPDAAVGPEDLSLVPALKPTAGKKPNIFIFVIDSLRQDYVSPYNLSVDFMPEIDRFAHDSIVMQNAFTRYAGTALSEPAIWVGAMQLHKQYIEPYYPMNNLQKLLETEGYQSYISVDPILHQILRPSSSITELDKDRTFWEDLNLIPTLKELEAKMAAQADPNKPIFAYTQPQNVHTLTLDRLHGGGSRRDMSIREIRLMDRAFGEFVHFLKDRGLYDNSIIVLTSDHGDAYGEFGRYGHSDFLVPEVMRIPLIIHLPPRLREKVAWDPQQISFTLDLTPSLYYLLGHRPTVDQELFGRPLFTQTLAEQTPYLRSQYLIASSYAPVYGLLAKGGKSLFIVDAVNRRNYFFDLADDPKGLHNHVTPRIRDDNEGEIRRQIGLIQGLYHYTPPEN
jgi:Sulfatase